MTSKRHNLAWKTEKKLILKKAQTLSARKTKWKYRIMGKV